MDEAGLAALSAAAERLLESGKFRAEVARLKTEIRRSHGPYVWSAVDISSHESLPGDIKSCWIFVLKAGVHTGVHRHPNSIQHMTMIEGRGTFEAGDSTGPMTLFGSPGITPGKAWLVIGRNVPHGFMPEGRNMVVISFHTCPADELEEVDCGTGSKRRYVSRLAQG